MVTSLTTRFHRLASVISFRQSLLLVGISIVVLYHIFRKPTNLGSGGSNSVQRSQWKTKAKACPKITLDELRERQALKSQFGEDQELLGYFNGLCGGTYIEMGGLDGVTGSNTFVFNNAFQWKGFLVELSPSSYKQLKQNRPNEIATANAAVCRTTKTLHYYDAGEIRNDPAVNGIWEYSQPSFRAMFWPNATIKDCKEVHCSPFQNLIDKHVGKRSFFDILSLDIEGAELEALETLDFSRVGFGMIVAENEPVVSNMRKTIGLQTLLERNGYKLIKKDGHNEWYINSYFDQIYADFITNG